MQKISSLPVLHPHAAGIDVGSRSHYVAINQNKDDIRCFGVFTEDHHSMIVYLKSKGIETIAMESTGTYWQTLYLTLEKAGFEVFLVCGNQTKNVKGRKTDVQDCQWIQWLHSVGMLSHSFIPSEFVAELRVYTRQRAKYVAQQTRLVNQLQRDLRSMNIRLEVALNDITGKSGRSIIEAILAGQRDVYKLAGLVDFRVKKSQEEIARSLEGNWNSAYLFLLKQHYQEYTQNLTMIQECDSELDKLLSAHLKESEIDTTEMKIHAKAKKKNKNKPSIDFSTYSYQYFGGIDLFAIEGVNQGTIMTLISEVGQDIFKFPTAAAFANWLHLCPNEKITGGKIISNHTKRGGNPLTQALKSAANAIGNMKTKSHLCYFFKKIAYKKGRKEAITATAHKLAVIMHNMITRVQPYKPFQREENKEKLRLKKLKEIDRIVRNHNIKPEEIVFSGL